MDDAVRADILGEILTERMRSLRHILDEWSVSDADPVTYAQAKDLIWQLAAPLGLSMLGFSAAERAQREAPGDLDLSQLQRQFARAGEESGRLLERFLEAAERVRG